MYGLEATEISTNFKESLKYTQVEIPKLKSPHDVLVRVKAAGVNPADAKLISGKMYITKWLITIPGIHGLDYSGVIEEKGSQVTDFEVGDEVYGMLHNPFGANGTFAQYTVVDTSKGAIAKKPTAMSFEQAATMGAASLTAYLGLVINCGLDSEKKLKEKRSIVVIGASGGIGGFAVHLAKELNPENTVIGICSSKNTEYVKSIGADKVVNYDDKEGYQRFLNETKDLDIIYDAVGGDNYYNDLDPLLAKNGVYSTAVGPMQNIGSEPVGILKIASIVPKILYKKLFGAHKYIFSNQPPFTKFGTVVAPLFESMQSLVREGNVVPLNEGYKAFEKTISMRTVGKLVLKVDE